jgi:RNA polymerase sigma-70 factor (ECF subfamily)
VLDRDVTPAEQTRSLPQLADDVVRRAQAGDERAFAEIVRTYERPILAFVSRSVRDRGYAEDLTQDVFLRVYQSLPGFGFQSKFTTWLYRIAQNRIIDETRFWKRRPRSVELEAVEERQHPDDQAEVAEAMGVLWTAIGELRPDHRDALVLKELAGWSCEEVASTLGLTVSTLKWRNHETRRHLQRVLVRKGHTTRGPGQRRRRETSSATTVTR